MDSSTLSTGLEQPGVARGQKWARVYAGIQNEKELQTAQKSGYEVQKTAGAPPWFLNSFDGWLFPERLFPILENGVPLGSSRSTGAVGACPALQKGSPRPRRGAQQAPGPEGVSRGLFHFKVKICRLWETIFKKVYNLHMPLNGGSS